MRTPALRWLAALVPPVLFAAFTVLSLFEHNQTELPIGLMWWPLALALLSAVVVFAVLGLVLRREAKAGVLASLLVIAFLYYGTWYVQFSSWGFSKGWFIALWAALFVFAAAAVIRTRRPLSSLLLVLGVAAAVVAVVPVLKIVAYQSKHPLLSASHPGIWPHALPAAPHGAAGRRPDIYVLIPDDYARADVLRRYFHYDNSRFVRALARRGFVVSRQARSPYSDSESNIAAELNMDYLSRFPHLLGARSQDVRPIKVVIEDNRAATLLKPLGYRYIQRDTDEVTFAAGNPHISPLATPDSFMTLWLQNTALRTIGGSLGFTDAAADHRFRD